MHLCFVFMMVVAKSDGTVSDREITWNQCTVEPTEAKHQWAEGFCSAKNDVNEGSCRRAKHPKGGTIYVFPDVVTQDMLDDFRTMGKR